VDARLVVARSRRGIEWGAADEQPIQIVLLALSPAEGSDESHHEFVARAVNVMRHQRNRQKLLASEGFDAVAVLMREVVP
jgi:mannitol/fructose-specific phosphotransferase system IIA component (Ntr-type)